MATNRIRQVFYKFEEGEVSRLTYMSFALFRLANLQTCPFASDGTAHSARRLWQHT